jgi:hypothetical protein
MYVNIITFKHINKKKVNFTLEQSINAQKGSTGVALPILTSALDGSEWLTSRPGHFVPGNDPVPTVQETGWAPRSFWTGGENLFLTGIRSPDHPFRSEPLYRLLYPGPQT